MDIILCTKEQAENYLAHYRTKGSKNGIRRWQDENGSLTPEGYRHYAEMYGWNKRVAKAERLQRRADKAADKADEASREADDDYVRAYKADRKNEFWESERSQRKADKAHERADESKAESEYLSVKARQAQRKASDYADKLQRKEDRLSKYMNDDGSLNEDALKKFTYGTGLPGERKMSLAGRFVFGREFSNKFNKDNANKMSKEETKAWEKSETQKFDEESAFDKKIRNFDKMNPEERKKFGDELLQKVNNKDGDEDERWSYRVKLVDLVSDKVGSINASDYKKGTNAEKAERKVNETWKKLSDREDQIKKDIRYNGNIQNSKKYKAEAQRLKRALEKDSIWSQLNKKYEKGTSDVMGAILKDLGFSDTPQNRTILYGYGWWD